MKAILLTLLLLFIIGCTNTNLNNQDKFSRELQWEDIYNDDFHNKEGP